MNKNVGIRQNSLRVTSVLGAFFIAFASFVVPPISAQSASALNLTDGSSEVINIEAGQFIQRSFTAAQGSLIFIGISNITGHVLNYNIYDSRGTQVDGCTNGFHCAKFATGAIQRTFIPPITDTYRIAFNFNSGSPFELVENVIGSLAGSLKFSLSNGIPQVIPTLSGTRTALFLPTDAAKVFQFNATQGQTLFYGISNASEGVLNYSIYDSGGKQVDDCTPGFHCDVYQSLAKKKSFSPPVTGTYYIALVLDGGAGSFKGIFAGTVKLSLSGGIQNLIPTLSGTSTASFLPKDAAKVFQFAATLGQQMPYEISNASNGVLDYNIYDSAGKQVDSCVVGFPCSVYQSLANRGSFNPPATGTYFIALILAGGSGSDNGIFTGNVKLSFSLASPSTSSPKVPTTPKAIAKKITITCIKGKLIKKVTAQKPVCAKGYKKR